MCESCNRHHHFFLQEGKEGAPTPVWRGSKKDKEKLPPDIVVIGKKKQEEGDS